MSTKLKKMTLVQQYKQLEELVVWFEKDEIDLEEGIRKFEEGIELVKNLKQRLSKLESRIVELKKLGN